MFTYSQHSQLSSILNFPCTVIEVKHFCDKFKAHHAYCGKHLHRNDNEVTKKPKESLSPSQFGELATSPTEASYQWTFIKLCSTAPKTAAYINNVDHSKWNLYAISKTGCITFGTKTSNAAEQSNSEIGVIAREKAQHKHPLKAVEQMLHNFNKVVTGVQEHIQHWYHEYQTLTPYYTTVYEKTVNERKPQLCKLNVASMDVKATVHYSVINPNTNLIICQKQCIVDLSRSKPPDGTCDLVLVYISNLQLLMVWNLHCWNSYLKFCALLIDLKD